MKEKFYQTRPAPDSTLKKGGSVGSVDGETFKKVISEYTLVHPSLNQSTPNGGSNSTSVNPPLPAKPAK